MSLLKKYNELMKVILGINENIYKKKRFEKNVRGVPIVCLTLNTNTHTKTGAVLNANLMEP